MNNWRDFERAIDQELFELFDKTSAETIDRDIDQASLLVGRTLKVPTETSFKLIPCVTGLK